MNKLLHILIIVVCFGCTNNPTEKHQNKRDKIVNVHEQVKGLNTGEVLIGSFPFLYVMNNYLFISDYRSLDKLIHIFDKKTFRHITSLAQRGQGPGELTNVGHIAINEPEGLFYVSDHGKQCIFSYNLDSVLSNPSFMPEVKMIMNKTVFPDRYTYISDTLSIGIVIERIGGGKFNQSVGKCNMQTGNVSIMEYVHQGIDNKRIFYAVSKEHGIYVECHTYYDLMTICSLDGELKYNIYGKHWKNASRNRISQYSKVIFCSDKIFALYSGERDIIKNNNLINSFSRFIVFDINGDYLKTIETGFPIIDFCYDEKNNRIFMSLDDEIQFAYLELDGLI
ncbi:MAG: 6-bladed beta-propeller [Tannerellaceae bacterium]|nr:6-bladed beta-propeller [Tannerellaceae bacterium]